MDRTDIKGQEKLLTKLDKMIDDGTLPRCFAIYGWMGCGKRYISRYVSERLGATFVCPEPEELTVDYAKEIVENAYLQSSPIVYCLPNIDLNMSGYKIANVLLKVIEEPPNNAYFIITATYAKKIPYTILSRIRTYRTQPYDEMFLKHFAEEHNIEWYPELFRTLQTPGELIDMYKARTFGMKEFEDYIESVVENIGEVSGTNAFKLADKLSFNDGEGGYPLKLFFTKFKRCCFQKAQTADTDRKNMYYRYMKATSVYENKLDSSVLNRRELFDLWILDVRETYLSYNCR